MTVGEYFVDWYDMLSGRPWNGCDVPLTNVLGKDDECRLRKGHMRKRHLPHYKRTWAERWYRVFKGEWCTHSRWKNYPNSGLRVELFTPWEMGPTDHQKNRFCKMCGRWEVT